MTEQNLPEPDWDDGLKRLIDQTTGPATTPPAGSDPNRQAPASANPAPAVEVSAAPTVEDLLLERTADLQRLQAEYVNYKKRVDRDRALARQGGIEAVLNDLLPVLDGIEAARAHDELTAGAKLLADELAKVTAKYGLESFGQADEPFDPHVHDALMTLDKPGYAVISVAQVFQLGYKVKDRILRPARVAVAGESEQTEPPAAEPAEPAAPEAAASDPAVGTTAGPADASA
jgi:molecular chaperone GrpE